MFIFVRKNTTGFGDDGNAMAEEGSQEEDWDLLFNADLFTPSVQVH